jgi:putative oxidoreductase
MFSNEGGGWEFPAFWAIALLVQAMLGDGALALRLPARNRSAAGVPA